MDEIEKEIKLLSDKEKLSRLEYETNYYYIRMLILNLKNNELKLENIDKLNDFDKIELVKNFDSDELKLKYIEKLGREDFYKVLIAESMKFDENKIKALSLVNDKNVKKYIIMSLKSDKNKINMMKQHLTPFEYKEIIESLSSTKNKIDNLDFIKNEYDKQKIIENIDFENDNKRLLIASYIRKDDSIETDNLICKIVLNIKNEEKRMQTINLVNEEFFKQDIILTLQDKNKIKFVEEIKNEEIQNEIIKSISDDKIKIAYLNKIKNESIKSKIITSLEDDELKIQQIESNQIKEKINLVRIISSLIRDENKLNQINKLKNSQYINLINMSLKNIQKLKEIYLKNDRRYSRIGLDEKITIGIEIESEGKMSPYIRELKRILKKITKKEKRAWEAKEDSSLRRGVELVSPILTDKEEDIEEIYMVCSMLDKTEQKITDKCGGHIHIGANYLTSKDSYINLFEIWGNSEKIIYKISNEKGQIPRSLLQEYAQPISPKLHEAIEKGTINLENKNDLNEFIDEVQKIQGDRFSDLNLLNINNIKNTIEFRIANGTKNPEIWIENARLFGRIVETSQKIFEMKNQIEKKKEYERKTNLISKLKNNIPEYKKMEVLLELLFTEEERNIYRERYYTNTKLMDELQNKENPLREAMFSKVDFNKKHNIKEFYDITIKNKIGDIKEIIKETLQSIKSKKVLKDNKSKNLEEK